MAVVRLKGLNRVRKTLASGREVVYWYAWKGGPQLPGKPGDPEFVAAYNAAVADRRKPTGKTLAALVTLYRSSPEFARTADSTKAEWNRWLDRIADTASELAIGELPQEALNDTEARSELLDWRDQWASTPRQADYAIQVLSRVLSWSVGRGKLKINVIAGTEQLYASDRADKVWPEDAIARYRAAAPSPEVAFIVPLACLSGLRRGDLAKLSWAHRGPSAIVMSTGKSRGRKTIIVPILPELDVLLDEIRAQQERRYAEACARALKNGKPPPPYPTTILSNTRCRPWSEDGLEHQVIDTKTAAGIDLHLHDARGTFATRLRKAGLKASEIADVLGWEEDRVERLLATYVDMDSIVMSIAARLQRNEPEPESPN